jgi:hypothetical protein
VRGQARGVAKLGPPARQALHALVEPT